MSEALRRVVLQRIPQTHGWLLKAIEELTADELARRFTPTATPIGWHLWHMSRWADRLQGSFPNRSFATGDRWDPRRQLWVQESLASRWGLDAASLGILETGSWMDQDAAGVVARVGREPLIGYARRAFGAVDAVVASLQGADLELSRNSIMEFVNNPEGPGATQTSGAATTVAGDLAFHFSHASRHLGMIEGLRGMLGRNGTATM